MIIHNWSYKLVLLEGSSLHSRRKLLSRQHADLDALLQMAVLSMQVEQKAAEEWTHTQASDRPSKGSKPHSAHRSSFAEPSDSAPDLTPLDRLQVGGWHPNALSPYQLSWSLLHSFTTLCCISPFGIYLIVLLHFISFHDIMLSCSPALLPLLGQPKGGCSREGHALKLNVLTCPIR